MPSRTPPVIILLFLVATLITACSTREGLKPAPEEAQPPICLRIKGTFEMNGLKGRVLILAREPDLIRVELYGAMNTLLMAVAGDGRRCSFYRDGKVGGCSWENSILVGPEELVSIITARYQRLTGWKNRKDKDGRVVRLAKYHGDSPLVVITIDGYRAVGERLLPASLLIRGKGRKLRLEFREITPEPSIGMDSFRLGFRREALPPSILS